MNEKEILVLAQQEGFKAALTTPRQVPVDGRFRAFCEENRCGKYGANYSCPPDCGPVDVLHQKLLAEEHVLVVQTIWDIKGYDDKASVQHAKMEHNKAVLCLMEKMKAKGYSGFCSGYNGCPLCDPCRRVMNQPCAHPDRKISCMSAYCIDVQALAERCRLEFAWASDKLYLFGIIAFHGKGNAAGNLSTDITGRFPGSLPENYHSLKICSAFPAR